MTLTILPHELPSYTPLSSSAFVWSEIVDGAEWFQLHMQKWCIGGMISFSHPLARLANSSPQSLHGCSVQMAQDLASNHHPQGSHGHACIPSSKTTHHQKHVVCLQWRLDSWQVGDINNLDAPFNTTPNRITGTHALIRKSKLHGFSTNWRSRERSGLPFKSS